MKLCYLTYAFNLSIHYNLWLYLDASKGYAISSPFINNHQYYVKTLT